MMGDYDDDTDNYEYQQALASEGILSDDYGVGRSSIFDSKFFGMPRHEMYLSWVDPTEFPDEKQPRLENWHPEDLEAYCGGSYTKYENYRQRWVTGVKVTR